MRVDYEEFEKVEDIMAYLVAVAPLMKQIVTINSYKGYTFALIPLSPLSGENILMVYTKQQLEPGLFEFDLSTQKYKKVMNVERADKSYFIVISPKRNTLADEAIKGIESN
ncbi:MAG: hypothetical protein QW416_03020 [Candidatus Nitrosocaldaceae archaeon]